MGRRRRGIKEKGRKDEDKKGSLERESGDRTYREEAYMLRKEDCVGDTGRREGKMDRKKRWEVNGEQKCCN